MNNKKEVRMFDNYTLKARFYPVIILFFPLILLGVFYSFEFKTAIHLMSSLGLVGALIYLFSQLGRDSGKLKEPALWQSWGGSPSTQILRLKNTIIDQHTKKRYHQKLQSLCPISVPPDINMESVEPERADEIYRAWTKYLISQTRDAQKFSLLLKDNISYGFRRNLWGLKRYAIISIISMILINYLVWGIKNKTYNPLLFSESFIYSSCALIMILLFWIIAIKASWVKMPAFSYAERLCEATESLIIPLGGEKKIITI